MLVGNLRAVHDIVKSIRQQSSLPNASNKAIDYDATKFKQQWSSTNSKLPMQ